MMENKKLFQLICAGFLILTSPHAFAKNSGSTNEHFLFFGDSLVDTGNYPEPSNVKNPNLMNFNLYVPITNPINVHDSGFRNFLTASLGMPKEQGKINHVAKVKFSANWPLYLTYKLNSKVCVQKP